MASSETSRRVDVVRLPSLRRSRFAPSALELLSFCGQAAWNLTRETRQFRADGSLAFFAIPSGYFAARTAKRLACPWSCRSAARMSPDFPGVACAADFNCAADRLSDTRWAAPH